MKNLLLAVVIASVSVFAQQNDEAENDYEKKIDELFAAYTGDVPGASVAVIKNGKIILSKNYGLAVLENVTPVTSETNFRLASFTKQFTAACILMLEERGKLNLDDKLTDIFPDFPEYGDDITIDMIVHHTSGLIAYESLIPDSATVQVLDSDVLDMMMSVDSTYFEPGTDYRYSNSGYAVLAMIIEKVSGKSFAEFLDDNIFTPLEMENSVAYEKTISEVERRALGYRANESGGFDSSDQSITSAVLGDGGIYSSTSELYYWDQALYGDKIYTDEMKKTAFTPGSLKNGEKLDYGFGWRIDEYKGHNRMHHTGGTSGFSTIIQRYYEDKFTVIILANRYGITFTDTADKIAEIMLIEK